MLAYNLSGIIENASKVRAVWDQWNQVLECQISQSEESISCKRRDILSASGSVYGMLLSSSTMNGRNLTDWVNAPIRMKDTTLSYGKRTIASATNNSFVFNAGVSRWYGTKDGFFLENKLSELDSPGEYWYDPSLKILYVYEITNSTLPSVTISKLQSCI